MITFNEILLLGGLDPRDVKILRHGMVGRPQIYDTWRSNRAVFEGFQARQGRNEVPEDGYVASFVVSRQDKTTFVGMFRSGGSVLAPEGDLDPLIGDTYPGRRIYDLIRVPGWEEYEGRLVIEWPSGSAGRAWHRRASSAQWRVLEIADQHDPWPGWRQFYCLADELPRLPAEWRSMLAHTKGVYLLIDLNDGGRQYVGSAKGTDNLLGRLLGYTRGGTNGNKGLTRGHSYRISVLEPVAMLTPDQTIEDIESQWKDRLGTRLYGLNQN